MKANPIGIIRAHYATLVDAETGHPLVLEYVVSLGVPVLVGIYCGVQEVKLPAVASGGLLTVCGLVFAFLFAAMLQMSQRAMDMSDSDKPTSKSITDHAEFVLEIAANSNYASLVSAVGAGVFVVAAVTSKTVLACASTIGLALMTHLAVLMLIVMQRVYSVTKERLLVAHTGAEQAPRPPRMTVVDGGERASSGD
jgi:hypothetical protein